MAIDSSRSSKTREQNYTLCSSTTSLASPGWQTRRRSVAHSLYQPCQLRVPGLRSGSFAGTRGRTSNTNLQRAIWPSLLAQALNRWVFPAFPYSRHSGALGPRSLGACQPSSADPGGAKPQMRTASANVVQAKRVGLFFTLGF